MSYLILLLFQLISTSGLALLMVAFFSLYERKVMGLIQERVGPNKVTLLGSMQPISDALKLMSKVQTSPSSVNTTLYYFCPFISFSIPMMVWAMIPVNWVLLTWSMGLVALLVYFSVSVYSLLFSGWYSNSKYSFLGCVRAVSQSISYEVGLTLIVVVMGLSVGSLSLFSFLYMQELMWMIVSHIPMAVGLFIVVLAETNRSPFDLTEGESELVSGYSVEYGGLSYTLIFLGENLSIMWANVVMSFMFGGSSLLFWFSMVTTFVVIRSVTPRMRFDKLMMMFWVSFLPVTLSLSWLTLVSCS